jgi:hypothetical protein
MLTATITELAKKQCQLQAFAPHYYKFANEMTASLDTIHPRDRNAECCKDGSVFQNDVSLRIITWSHDEALC